MPDRVPPAQKSTTGCVAVEVVEPLPQAGERDRAGARHGRDGDLGGVPDVHELHAGLDALGPGEELVGREA